MAIAPLIARAQSIELAGAKVSVPAPADLLFILCLNGAKDGWPQLQRLCDVTACLQRYPKLDWVQLNALAEQATSQRVLSLGLSLAEALLGASLPAAIAPHLTPRQSVQRLQQTVAKRLLSGVEPPLTLMQQAYFPLQVQDNWQRRYRYCYGLLWPLNERDLAFAERWLGRWATLPKLLYPLYYLLRWLRLLLKYSGGWFSKPTADQHGPPRNNH
ncbi:MAG: nucleotidyltransferase family protein [Spirulinaceae cyanobacterium SM2_1_0]|nr:nucleotidyltransferase family protein [Spirulinaceae cyanobacterium SM2_1_0]